MPALLVLPVLGSTADPATMALSAPSGSMSADLRLIDELRPVRILGTSVDFFKIRDVNTAEETVVILSQPTPAVHVFSGRDHFEWGKEGGGPGEFRNPIAVRLAPRGDRVLISEALPGRSRVVQFTARGELIREHRVDPLDIVTQFEIIDDHVIVQGGDLGGERVHVVRLGTRPDTLLSFPRARQIKIQSEEGPTRSYPVSFPYQAIPQWTVTPKGLLALWDGRSDQLILVDTEGKRRGTIGLPFPPLVVQATDRDLWYEKEFPTDFLGRRDDPLRVIREKAGEVITFPSEFPRVLDLMGDARGGVWVKRTPSSQGEVWSLVGGRSSSTVRFPAGREVQSFGSRYVVATAVNEEMGTELVELYALSDVEKHGAQRSQ